MKSKALVPVILAGGAGTRLWPLSRKSYPKQFTNLFGTDGSGEYTAIAWAQDGENFLHNR